MSIRSNFDKNIKMVDNFIKKRMINFGSKSGRVYCFDGLLRVRSGA